jgi:hypothetical protein
MLCWLALAQRADHNHHHNEVTCEVSVIICSGVSRKLIATPPPLAQVRSSLLQRLLIALHPLSGTRLASQMRLYSTRRGVCQSSSKGEWAEAKRAQKFMPKENSLQLFEKRDDAYFPTFPLAGVPRVCVPSCVGAPCMVATAMTPIHETNGANGVAHNGNGVADVGDSPIKAFYAGRCVCVCVWVTLCVVPTTRARLSSSTPPLLTIPIPNPKAHGYLVCASQLQHGMAQQCFVRDSSFLQRGGRGLVLTACQVLDSHTCGLGERIFFCILHLLAKHACGRGCDARVVRCRDAQ